MKQTVLLLTFACTLGTATAQWSEIFETGNIFGLIDISAPNDNIAWACLSSDSAYRTADGGLTWDRIRLPEFEPNYQISNIYALDENTAFLCGQVIFTGEGPGIVYKTSNGGVSWENVFQVDSNCTFTMHFKNELEGIMTCFTSVWFGGSTSFMKRTTDGGNTWTSDITEPDAEFYGFTNQGMYAKGDSIWLCDIDGNMHYSDDMASSWTQIFTATFSNVLRMPAFKNSDYGMVFGTLGFFNTLMRTTDGITYNSISEDDPNVNGVGIARLAMDDEEMWYIYNPGPDYYVMYSSDSGNTFTEQFETAEGIKSLTQSRNGHDLWALNAFSFTFGSSIFKYEHPEEPVDTGEVFFSADTTTICQNSCINFSDLSTNSPTFWEWHFEGSLTPVAISANPTDICYAENGVFDVELITTSATGTDTLLLENYITVIALPDPPMITQTDLTVIATGGYDSYTWYFNGDLMIGETDNEVPAMDGTYVLTVTNELQCSTTITYECQVLSIRSPTMHGVTLYPNPVDDILMIAGTIDNIVSVSVVNTIGVELFCQQSCTDLNYVLTTASLAAGNYYCICKSDIGTRIILPFIVEH